MSKCDYCEFSIYDVECPEVGAICNCNEDCKECPYEADFDDYNDEQGEI